MKKSARAQNANAGSIENEFCATVMIKIARSTDSDCREGGKTNSRRRGIRGSDGDDTRRTGRIGAMTERQCSQAFLSPP